jgi:hypothetical protein
MKGPRGFNELLQFAEKAAGAGVSEAAAESIVKLKSGTSPFLLLVVSSLMHSSSLPRVVAASAHRKVPDLLVQQEVQDAFRRSARHLAMIAPCYIATAASAALPDGLYLLKVGWCPIARHYCGCCCVISLPR